MAADGFDLTPPTPQQRKGLEAALTREERHVLLSHGTEAPFCGTLLGNKEAGVYCCRLCGLPPVHRVREVRERHRLAQLHRTLRRGAPQARARHQLRHGAHRDPLRPLRQPPGPRLPRRPAADRPALLHQLGRPRVHAARAAAARQAGSRREHRRGLTCGGTQFRPGLACRACGPSSPAPAERVPERLRVVLAGITVADTTSGWRVLETSHPPSSGSRPATAWPEADTGRWPGPGRPEWPDRLPGRHGRITACFLRELVLPRGHLALRRHPGPSGLQSGAGRRLPGRRRAGHGAGRQLVRRPDRRADRGPVQERARQHGLVG